MHDLNVNNSDIIILDNTSNCTACEKKENHINMVAKTYNNHAGGEVGGGGITNLLFSLSIIYMGLPSVQ
jgi:hypothetical protein